MKLLVFLLAFNAYSFAQNQKVGITLGAGSLEGEAVNVNAIDYQYFLQNFSLFQGKLRYGFGPRISTISANKFALYEDEEFVEDVALTLANIAFYSEFQLQDLILGFNIDLLGITSGKSGTIEDTNEEVDPIKTNLLLWAENDKGSLNSEFWLGYHFDNVTLRGGLAHIVLEYEGDKPTNEKRQRFFDTFFLSAQYSF